MAIDFNYHGPVVVFDLDDTLIRERDFCRTGFLAIQRHLCQKYPGERFSHLAVDMEGALVDRKPYIPILEDALGSDLAGMREELLDIYGTHTEPGLQPIDGVIETLDELQRRGIVMGIITDGRGRTQRAKLQSAGLLPYFSPDMIYISEESGLDKQTTESFADIVRQYPEAKKFIYVGDNPEKDILSPTLLGWETAIVAYNDDNVHSRINIASQTFAPTYTDIKINDILEIIA